ATVYMTGASSPTPGPPTTVENAPSGPTGAVPTGLPARRIVTCRPASSTRAMPLTRARLPTGETSSRTTGAPPTWAGATGCGWAGGFGCGTTAVELTVTASQVPVVARLPSSPA